MNATMANKTVSARGFQPPAKTRVVTGLVRLSYAHIWRPQSFNGQEAKYSVSIIIPKSDTATIERIQRAIEAAYQEGQHKLRGANRSAPPLAALKTPLRDGDVERPDDPAYANAVFLNATSRRAPGIVDLNREPITVEDEVYSGVYARVSLNFYVFSVNGNRGVAAGLNHIQKVRDGDALGGGATAQQDFADEIDEDILIPF